MDAYSLGEQDYWKYCYYPNTHCPFTPESPEYDKYMLGWNEAESTDTRLPIIII
jgi:hypothetical protein